MSFEGVKGLDKLINDEITSLDQLILQSNKDIQANMMARNVLRFKSAINESCDNDEKENMGEEHDILYPDESRVRNSFRSLTNIIPQTNDQEVNQISISCVRRSQPQPIRLQVQSRYSARDSHNSISPTSLSCIRETKEESQLDFSKCQKEPLKDLKNSNSKKNSKLNINEDNECEDIYEEEEEENDDEEDDVNDYIDKLRKAK